MNLNKKRYGFLLTFILAVMLLLLQIMFAIPVAIFEFLIKYPLTKHLGVVGLINTLSFGIIVFIAMLIIKKPAKHLMPLKRCSAKYIFPSTLCIIGLHILVSELDNIIHQVIPFPRNTFLLEGIQLSFWGALIGLVVIAPLTEELFFRGILSRGALIAFGKHWTIFIASLVFAIVHLNLDQIPGAFLIGLFLGWLAWQTDSLLPSIYTHALANALSLAAVFLPFAIPGYNVTSGFPNQPLWFNLMGLFLLASGIFWLTKTKSAQEIAKDIEQPHIEASETL